MLIQSNCVQSAVICINLSLKTILKLQTCFKLPQRTLSYFANPYSQYANAEKTVNIQNPTSAVFLSGFVSANFATQLVALQKCFSCKTDVFLVYSLCEIYVVFFFLLKTQYTISYIQENHDLIITHQNSSLTPASSCAQFSVQLM